MDLILKRATIAGREAEGALDIIIEGGRIAAIAPSLDGAFPAVDLDGRLVSADGCSRTASAMARC